MRKASQAQTCRAEAPCQWVTSLSSSASRPALSADCKFTCHYRCRALVCLDCCGPRDLGWDPALERDTNVVSSGSGECGQGGVPGLSPGAVHNEHPNYRFPDIGEASSACGFVRSLPHAKTTARKPVAAKARPGTLHAHFSHPASGPGATSVRMRTRPAASPGDVEPERRSRVEMPPR